MPELIGPIRWEEDEHNNKRWIQHEAGNGAGQLTPRDDNNKTPEQPAKKQENPKEQAKTHE